MNQNDSNYFDGLFSSGSIPAVADILIIIILIWILFTLISLSATLKALLEEYQWQEDNKNPKVKNGANPRHDIFSDIDEDDKKLYDNSKEDL